MNIVSVLIFSTISRIRLTAVWNIDMFSGGGGGGGAGGSIIFVMMKIISSL